jgi:hypothetical protein
MTDTSGSHRGQPFVAGPLPTVLQSGLIDSIAIWREQSNWLIVEDMSAKEILLDVAEKLPPNATLTDAIYELEFRQAVQEGLASLDRGERVSLEEARQRIPRCVPHSFASCVLPQD